MAESGRGKWAIAGTWGVRAIIGGCASWLSWLVIIQSGKREAYAPEDAHLWLNFQYPTNSVILTIAFIIGEALLVERFLHRRASERLWPRALVGGVALAPLSAVAIGTLMELPPYHAIHSLWIAVVNALLVGIAVASGVAHLVKASYGAWKSAPSKPT